MLLSYHLTHKYCQTTLVVFDTQIYFACVFNVPRLLILNTGDLYRNHIVVFNLGKGKAYTLTAAVCCILNGVWRCTLG